MKKRRQPVWYVYIIQCADKTLYTGITTDVPRRLSEHNAKSGGHYTRARTPVELLYHEIQPDKSCALKREMEIKGWPRTRKLALISNYAKEKISDN